MSDGLIGDASTRTTTSSSAGGATSALHVREATSRSTRSAPVMRCCGTRSQAAGRARRRAEDALFSATASRIYRLIPGEHMTTRYPPPPAAADVLGHAEASSNCACQRRCGAACRRRSRRARRGVADQSVGHRLLFGAADLGTASLTGSAAAAVMTGADSASGDEGDGRSRRPVAAGGQRRRGASSSPPARREAAQALLGRTVAGAGRRHVCPVPLPQGPTRVPGAAAGNDAGRRRLVLRQPAHRARHVETMRREGHKALVHTRAASNLGQMLNRICLADGIGLVNIVRRPEQAQLLRAQGAAQVCV